MQVHDVRNYYPLALSGFLLGSCKRGPNVLRSYIREGKLLHKGSKCLKLLYKYDLQGGKLWPRGDKISHPKRNPAYD